MCHSLDVVFLVSRACTWCVLDVVVDSCPSLFLSHSFFSLFFSFLALLSFLSLSSYPSPGHTLFGNFKFFVFFPHLCMSLPSAAYDCPSLHDGNNVLCGNVMFTLLYVYNLTIFISFGLMIFLVQYCLHFYLCGSYITAIRM